MDWRVKALIQKFCWRLPYGARLNALLSELRSGHDPQTELMEKHIPTFFRHWEILRRTEFLSKTPGAVLEIGTGWDFDTALLMSLSGVQRIFTADIIRHISYAHVRKSLILFEPFLPEIAARTQRDPQAVTAEWKRLLSAPSLARFCEDARICYFAPVSSTYREVENESIDVCFSTAVFEHIPSDNIRIILEATRRKLRSGGLSSHIIDLKDHFAYFQAGLPYNNFLRYSVKTWNWWADNPMSYLNRMSPSEWRKMFIETGYDLVEFQEFPETALPALDEKFLHGEQQYRSKEDLKTGELHVVARRR